ncbi:MAG: hypothetical protein E7508_04925 [Ruminococcus sp.]|nr:hypothetical protein [Ruminococcus sp.]
MQEINTNKLRELIKKRDTLHPLDDYGAAEIREKMLYYCGNNEKDIIEFLSTLNLNDLEWMGEIFEDISIKLNKSKTFKKALEEITSKYPHVDFCLQYC